ncbi:hypothetical protein LguiB_027356 [Lonicera macranthoides]
MDLSSIRFKGLIPLLPHNMSSLNLSNNMFSGSITSLCIVVTELLGFLDLSDNLLSGEVPDCWINGNNLEILDLENNNFSWKIPVSFSFLYHLKLLNLRNNSLVGELPSSLNNCSSLRVIDVSENKLSGELPAWIGTYLTLLAILSFRRNDFHGSIPFSMCLLNLTQVLDLSQNKISGNIPQCFKKFYTLIQTESSSTIINILSGAIPTNLGRLNSLSVLDLSSNKFSGKIPRSTQLDTFNASVYSGNDKLCGLPLPLCAEDGSTSFPPSMDHGKAEDTSTAPPVDDVVQNRVLC